MSNEQDKYEEDEYEEDIYKQPVDYLKDVTTKSNFPDNINIRQVGKTFYIKYDYEKAVKEFLGKYQELDLKDKIPHMRILKNVYLVDMRPIVKNLSTWVYATDLPYKFDIAASIRYEPTDVLKIVIQRDRIEADIERKMLKDLTLIGDSLTRNAGWRGTLISNVMNLEERLRQDLSEHGVEYTDSFIRIYCPNEFIRLAKAQPRVELASILTTLFKKWLDLELGYKKEKLEIIKDYKEKLIDKLNSLIKKYGPMFYANISELTETENRILDQKLLGYRNLDPADEMIKRFVRTGALENLAGRYGHLDRLIRMGIASGNNAALPIIDIRGREDDQR